MLFLKYDFPTKCKSIHSLKHVPAINFFSLFNFGAEHFLLMIKLNNGYSV